MYSSSKNSRVTKTKLSLHILVPQGYGALLVYCQVNARIDHYDESYDLLTLSDLLWGVFNSAVQVFHLV